MTDKGKALLYAILVTLGYGFAMQLFLLRMSGLIPAIIEIGWVVLIVYLWVRYFKIRKGN